MLRIDITEPVLRWAINRTRTPIENLKNTQDFKLIEEWLSGTIRPTLRQAEKLAKKAGIPFGYLLLAEPVNDLPDMVDFRTVDSKRVSELSPELEDVIHRCQARLNWYIDFAREVGETSPTLSGRYRITDNSLQVAQSILNEIDWYPGKREPGRERVLTLSDDIEKLGILVMRSSVVGNDNSRKLSIEEFRGFTLMEDHFSLIFINGADYKVGQLFSLAHEFGHVLLGAPGLSGERNEHGKVERWCNQFAAELLIPKRKIIAQWREIEDPQTMIEWGYQNYGVSADTVVWKLVDSNLLSRNRAVKFLSALPKVPNMEATTGGNFYNNTCSRLGYRFTETVTGALVDGLISQQEASRQLGIPKTQTLNELVRRIHEVDYQGVA